MLLSLHIENFALIRQSDIRFGDGFVAITGETGAGKTILLDALGLLLGQRCDNQMLGDKERKCVVEAHFNIAGLGLETFLTDNDLDCDTSLIIRREALPNGKSRAFVNDTPVNLATLKTLGSRLVDIHSQHETLLLSDHSFRVALLDTYAGNGETMQHYRESYHRYTAAKQRLERLSTESQQYRKEADYWQFLFDELSQARLVADEQDALEEESRLLANAIDIKEALEQAVQLCEGEESGVLAQLRNLHTLLNRNAAYHKELPELGERVESLLIEMRDISDELSTLDNRITFDPERQQEVDERLSLLYRLEKKHQVDQVSALIALRDELEQRLLTATHSEEALQQAMEEVDAAYGAVQQYGSQLTASRKAAAQLIGQAVGTTLADLGMREATLRFTVTATDTYGPTGGDSVQIHFNANRGGESRELAKVASGGEMSRIMLALKSLITAKTLLPTIIFDEIDTGISGDISLKAGQILRRMSAHMQVVVITHSPQIAALAGQHLKVYKTLDGNDPSRTVSNISPLDGARREEEIATMLSSENPTEAALQTARELLQR